MMSKNLNVYVLLTYPGRKSYQVVKTKNERVSCARVLMVDVDRERLELVAEGKRNKYTGDTFHVVKMKVNGCELGWKEDWHPYHGYLMIKVRK